MKTALWFSCMVFFRLPVFYLSFLILFSLFRFRQFSSPAYTYVCMYVLNTNAWTCAVFYSHLKKINVLFQDNLHQHIGKRYVDEFKWDSGNNNKNRTYEPFENLRFCILLEYIRKSIDFSVGFIRLQSLFKSRDTTFRYYSNRLIRLRTATMNQYVWFQAASDKQPLYCVFININAIQWNCSVHPSDLVCVDWYTAGVVHVYAFLFYAFLYETCMCAFYGCICASYFILRLMPILVCSMQLMWQATERTKEKERRHRSERERKGKNFDDFVQVINHMLYTHTLTQFHQYVHVFQCMRVYFESINTAHMCCTIKQNYAKRSGAGFGDGETKTDKERESERLRRTETDLGES